MNKYLRMFVNVGAVIKQVEAIRLHIDDHEECERRCKILRQYGFLPPKNKAECNQMIKDLVEWQI